VTLPIKIDRMDSTRKRLVEINVEEDRKIGISSITNIGMKLFTGVNKAIYGVHITFIKLGYYN